MLPAQQCTAVHQSLLGASERTLLLVAGRCSAENNCSACMNRVARWLQMLWAHLCLVLVVVLPHLWFLILVQALCQGQAI